MPYLFESEEHAALRAQVARFAESAISPHAQAWEEAAEFPRELYPAAAAAGVLGIGFPVEYGGSGGDITHQIVASEALTLHGRSVGTAVGLGSHLIALPPILLLGSEAQKQRYVTKVLAGEWVSALAITEPGGGSDVAALQTMAERVEDRYVVNGSKLYITSGCRADVIVTAVRTDPDRSRRHLGLSLLVVERDLPGFSPSRKLSKMGWSASDTAELSFADCQVPLANRLGDEGSAFFAIIRNFAAERLLLAAQCVAIAQLAYDESVAFAKLRTTFGKPLSRHQVIRHKLADMATQLWAARAFVGESAIRCQRGEVVMSQLAMCKNTATDMCSFVVDQAVQIHGGLGYMRECIVERLYRDARLYPIGGGTREIMNEIIAQAEGY
ncbi:MAG: acyl-CoA dehydrogenase family protein [Myxococcales bacterium]|jgi:acyl-CoA dehydrogenase|nr:acyl-CoA dehydrogenase family protein [Myxococcales bacterium]